VVFSCSDTLAVVWINLVLFTVFPSFEAQAMNKHISLLVALSIVLVLLGGCGSGSADDNYVLKAATPPSVDDLARLMKQDAAFWDGQPSCLPGNVWPVRVNLTHVLDRGYDVYNKEVLPDLQLLHALETVGLVKGTVLTEKDKAYGTQVMTYAISYNLTEAAQPWVKSVPTPGRPAGNAETLQVLCFGKHLPSNPQNPTMVIGNKTQTASAWQRVGSPDTRAYLRYTLTPQPAFSVTEAALRKAAHIPSPQTPAEQRKIEAAYQLIDRDAGIDVQTSVIKVWRQGQGPWQIYNQSLQTQEDWLNWPQEEVEAPVPCRVVGEGGECARTLQSTLAFPTGYSEQKLYRKGP
jgi:hypothetical protein